jgi:tRNA/rRNA methyltransferase
MARDASRARVAPQDGAGAALARNVAAPYRDAMSGTNRARAPEWSPEGPVFVLVRPQLGENVGAAARAMWNFGLRRMRVVAPRDGWPNERAVATASGAGGLLDEAMLADTTAQAVADLSCVYATTARPRELTKPVLTPEDAVADMARRIADGERVGVLFGPERTGLEQDDVVRANVIVTVPTNPAFASINLAQATLLMAYEWRKAAMTPPPPRRTPHMERPASQGEVDGLLAHLAMSLEEAGYFWPDHKAAALRDHLDNIFRRAPLTEQDVRTLRGAVRALHEGPRRRGTRGRAAPSDCADMEALRRAIDVLDRSIIGLLGERSRYIDRAAELKRSNGWPALIPERVSQVVRNARAAADAAGADPDLVEALWRRLIDHAVASEERRLAE